ncbi:hypothetical protein EPA93_22545 [Ktedonosporobacter rubrisoli]|uniref:Uncharacterized protein n=1 Tax=Ktedonosporobacter rubrisoli TaxID=2509675 RepID=A0A4P6JTJ7_KTERU|nr:hypothetical protein [Ktedonosporobacter rubrisoli]QBD78620.1 hypothetical protein EPA93_22545 [Ktedonosporobacter rubrisoli]
MSMQQNKLITVRKLAALAIVYHGSRLIIIEFALGVFFLGGFGIALSALGLLLRPYHPILLLLLSGCILLWIALNYIPLFIYSLDINKRKSARLEVAFELEYSYLYIRSYNLQSTLFLFIPFAMLILTLVQEWQKRRREH